MKSTATIQFSSMERVKDEKTQKLIDPRSPLYGLVMKLRREIDIQFGPIPVQRDPHIKIANRHEDPGFQQKAQSINGRSIVVTELSSWRFEGRAFVLSTGYVQAYGTTHLTIVFFDNVRPPALDVLQRLSISLAQEIKP